MRIHDVIRRPKRCPRCGGEICDIIYGLPCSTWEEDHLKATGHKAVLGGCCLSVDGSDPDFLCEDCELQFLKLSFPSNAKKRAFEALVKSDKDSIFCDVVYEGLYRKQMIFSPKSKPGFCWDGNILIFVDESGMAKVHTGLGNFAVLQKIRRDKEKYGRRTETFYRQAALREIKGNFYYKSVRKVGQLNGQRIYVPVFKDEYIKEHVCIGLPMVIMVNAKGNAMSIRAVEAIDIIKEAGKRKKK